MRSRTQFNGIGHTLAFLLFRAYPFSESGFLPRHAVEVEADTPGIVGLDALHFRLNLDNSFRFSRPLRLDLLAPLSFVRIERILARFGVFLQLLDGSAGGVESHQHGAAFGIFRQ